MKKLNEVIQSVKNNEWAKLVIRLMQGVLLVIFVHWYPCLFTWYSHTVLKKEFKYDESEHLLAIYFAYVMLLIIIISGIVTGMRLWRKYSGNCKK